MILRRFVILSFVIATVIPAVVLASAGPAAACSCVMRTEVQTFEDATAVFTGRVTDVLVTDDAHGARRVVWTFVVDHVYKGKVFRNEKVVTPFDSAACGLGAKPGTKPLLVFAHRARGQGKYSTSLCDGDRRVSEGPIPSEFGSGTGPRRRAQ